MYENEPKKNDTKIIYYKIKEKKNNMILRIFVTLFQHTHHE